MEGEKVFGVVWAVNDGFSTFGRLFVKPVVSERVSRPVTMVLGAAVSEKVKDGICNEKMVIFCDFLLVITFSHF